MSELFPVRTMALEVFHCTDEKRMSEFNVWYDKTCIPAYRQIPGVVSVHRYIARDFDYGEVTPGFFKAFWEKPVRMMTMFRINADDPQAVCEAIKAKDEELVHECIERLEFKLLDFYAVRRRIGTLERYPETNLPDGMPNMFLMIPNMNYPKDREALDDWWLYTHAHDLMEYPGYVECSRYHNISADYTVGDPLAINFYEIDSDDPVGLQIKNITEDGGRAKEGRIWGHFENPPAHPTNLIGIFEHWDIMSAL